MKKILSYTILCTLLAASVFGCKKEAPASISVLQDKYEVGFGCDSTTIGVLCNRAWTATTEADWIKLSPAQGEAFEAKSYIKMVVAMNDNGDSRTATVNIITDDGQALKTVDVYQDGNSEIIMNAAAFIAYLEKVEKHEATDGYRLGADIDLKDLTLPEVTSMIYKFDGCQHKIKNWVTSAPMFKEIAASGAVANFDIDESCKLTVPEFTTGFGFITATNNGLISMVFNAADVTVPAIIKGNFGIICGVNNATVQKCVNGGDIIFSGAPCTTGSAYLAGICGQSTGASALVSECVNEGTVSLTFNDVLGQSIYAAGVVGTNNANAKILGCMNSAAITVKCPGCKTNGQACGIVCYSGGELANCTNRGNISFFSESAEGKADGQVKGTAVAGIAGYEGWANGTMTNCENYGDITLRAGYPIGYQTVGSATKFATNVAGVAAHAWNCGFDGCKNFGKVTSEIKAIDKAPADGYQTTARHAIAGIVASSCGNIANCVNEGAVTANWITTTHNAALAKNFVMMAGGITGGCYNGNKTTESLITNCENKGAVYITCDSSGSNNNAGGIVGWSSNEAANTAVIEGCKNSGAVTHDGYGKVRFGGIAGAGSTLKNCENSGKVYLKGSTNNSCVGGILGWFNFNGVTGCKNTGDVQSDVNITNALAASKANYSSQAGIGGIVGGHGNTDVVFTGNSVNCKVTAPSGCKFASMIIGMTDRDKTAAVGKKLAVGTAEGPVKVKGSFGSTTLTSSNYKDYIKYTGYLNLNPDVTYNTVFGE